MSIEQKFEKNFGYNFILEEEEYPDYVISLGASNICALIDAEKFTKVIEWKPFTLLPFNTNKYGFIVYEEAWGYNVYFVEKAMETLDPDEYGFYVEYNFEQEADNVVLALKNNKYIIIIAPRPFEKDEESGFKLYKWEDHVKKAPKSVFVI